MPNEQNWAELDTRDRITLTPTWQGHAFALLKEISIDQCYCELGTTCYPCRADEIVKEARDDR